MSQLSGFASSFAGLSRTLVLISTFFLLVLGDNYSDPYALYKTQPALQPPALNFTLQDPSRWTDGYMFVAPFGTAQSGPYIYDKFGNLIWAGWGAAGPANAHNFHVCQYQGSNHLCFSAENQLADYGRGQAYVLDSNYHTVAAIQAGRDLDAADMHEFQLIGNGSTAIVDSYTVFPADLSEFGITNGKGFIVQGSFQEIEVATGNVLFQWNALDHVPLSASYVKPNMPAYAGMGTSPWYPYDYFHLNSVDKSTVTGNYLVSSRHTSSLFYVDGNTGDILWTLQAGGDSNFTCTNFNFSWQHDARLHEENETTTVVSIFDNASNVFNTSARESSGMIIALDKQNMTATMIQQTYAPLPNGLLSWSQGNTQVLPNGGVFHSWGCFAWVSEHAPNGDPVLMASIATDTAVMNYRAFSFEWESTPCCTNPITAAYAAPDKSAMTIYTSWNGATTVRSWKFYGGQDSTGSGKKYLGTQNWAGFETSLTVQGYYPWMFTEAYGPDGNLLRTSIWAPTFTPSEAIAHACNEYGCATA